MHPNPRHAALKRLFASRTTVAAPAAFDCLSAKLVEEAGFGAVYIGSYGTSASAFRLPDVGLLSVPELVQHAQRVAASVKLPVIADAEGGADEPENMWRVVRQYEDAGVSAIHIEDHGGGKHTDRPQTLIPLQKMLAKLRFALAARRDPGFQIIARTDAMMVHRDPAETLRRLQAFAAQGVDMVFPSGLDLPLAHSLRAAVPVPLVVTETPTGPGFAAAQAADLVIHYGFCLYAASKGISDALKQYRDAHDNGAAGRCMEDVLPFEQRMGYPHRPALAGVPPFQKAF